MLADQTALLPRMPDSGGPPATKSGATKRQHHLPDWTTGRQSASAPLRARRIVSRGFMRRPKFRKICWQTNIILFELKYRYY